MQGCKTGSGAVLGRVPWLAVASFLLGCGLLSPAIGQQVLPPMTPGSMDPGAGLLAPEAVGPVLNLNQRGVPAEATAENGVVARERALATGRRLAWERLLAEAGAPATPLSDSQIENLVASIVIEQERPSPTRYAGRITVNFSGSRVRSLLSARAPNLAALGGSGGGGLSGAGGVAGGAAVSPPAAPTPPGGSAMSGPASNWLEAVATYRSMGEWLELRRRLRGAGPVATVEVLGIAVDAARLRVGLRVPPGVAAADLAGLGIALEPALPAGFPVAPPVFPLGAAPASVPPGPTWRLGLAGGG